MCEREHHILFGYFVNAFPSYTAERQTGLRLHFVDAYGRPERAATNMTVYAF